MLSRSGHTLRINLPASDWLLSRVAMLFTVHMSQVQRVAALELLRPAARTFWPRRSFAKKRCLPLEDS